MAKWYLHTEKMHKSILKHDFNRPGIMQWSEFFDWVRDACHEMNLPTPVILKTHLMNFAKFNYVRFLASDFVESVDFDYLMIENIKE